MGSHSGSHHSSSSSHSGSHHSSSSSHSGSHHGSSGHSSGSHSNVHYHSRQDGYYRFRSSSGPARYYSENEIPQGAVMYNGTWYRQNGQLVQFDINMDDPYVAEHYDSKKTSWLYKKIKQVPIFPIIMFYAFFFAVFILFGIASSNIFYELVIPPFEAATMTDAAFYFVDEFIYNIQFVVPCAFMILTPILAVKRYKKSKLYEEAFAKETIDYYGALAEEKKIDYFAFCPSCGAAAGLSETGEKSKFCTYCGCSLKADNMQ